jgi:hypothetical protein
MAYVLCLIIKCMYYMEIVIKVNLDDQVLCLYLVTKEPIMGSWDVVQISP